MKAQRNFPDFLQAFVDFASYGEAPLSCYFWTGVGTVAGALRRCVWIDQAYFQWIPNFYIILVAPPGIISKSTTISIGLDMLREVSGIHFGPHAVTWPSLAKSLSEAREFIQLPNGDFHPISAIIIEASELGVFLDPTDRKMVDALVALWDGKLLTKDTKTQGSDTIMNPCVSILACTTPGWIEGYFPEYMVGGGFTSRCIFVFAETKRQLTAYPKLKVPKNFYGTRAKLVEDLEQISLMRGEYELTTEAIEWGERWYAKLWQEKPKHLDNDRYRGYLARKQTHLHKLSMIIAASRGTDMFLTPEHLQISDALLQTTEQDLPKVFDKIGRTQAVKGQHEILGILQTYQKIQATELYKLCFRTLTHHEFIMALESVVKAGLARVVNLGGVPWVHYLAPTP